MTESNKDQNLDRWKRFNSLKDTKKSINNLAVKAAAIAGHVLRSRPFRDDIFGFTKDLRDLRWLVFSQFIRNFCPTIYSPSVFGQNCRVITREKIA